MVVEHLQLNNKNVKIKNHTIITWFSYTKKDFLFDKRKSFYLSNKLLD